MTAIQWERHTLLSSNTQQAGPHTRLMRSRKCLRRANSRCLTASYLTEWRWASAHGNTSVWQLDAIEVAAGGLASVGVEGGAYGRVHDLGDCRNGFRACLVLNSCDVSGGYFWKARVVQHGQRVATLMQLWKVYVHELSGGIPMEEAITKAQGNGFAAIHGKCSDCNRVLLIGVWGCGNDPTAVRRYSENIQDAFGG